MKQFAPHFVRQWANMAIDRYRESARYVRRKLYQTFLRHAEILSEGSDTGRALAFLGTLEATGLPPDDNRLDELANFSAHFRENWIAAQAATLPPGARVLDAGAGQCPYRRYFAHTDYKTQDFSQYQGTANGPQKEHWAYPRLDYVSDITTVPASDASFDCILCTEVLEHLAEPILALREFSRLLTSSGRLLLSAPLGSGLHQEPYHFYGGFTPYFYNKFLTQYGFYDIIIRPIGGFPRHLGQECLRAARLAEQGAYPLDPGARHILVSVLPSLLEKIDEPVVCPEFTAGYCVEATRA